jgi:hypothetical protein
MSNKEDWIIIKNMYILDGGEIFYDYYAVCMDCDMCIEFSEAECREDFFEEEEPFYFLNN